MSGGLPKGWVETTFPHVALLNPKSSLDDDTEVAFVPMPHVPTNFSDTLRFEKKLWRDVKRGFTHFRNDDVIFAKITPCFENGKAAIVSGLPNAHGAGSTEFYVLRPVIVPSALLFYWVKTAAFLKTAEAHMTGTVGQKRVPKTFVESYPFPLPPLNEQKRIVAKLDAIMPRIDSVKERLEKIPAILKRFRQSVLTAAVTGKLTEKWREEHPGMAEWEDMILHDVISNNGIFDGPFGSNLKTSDYVDSGVRVIRLENIEHLEFLEEKAAYISDEKYETLLKHTVNEGDIIFSSFISERLRACILPQLTTKAIAKADCFCIRVNAEKSIAKFLLLALVSFDSYKKLIDQVHGATRPRVNLTQLKRLLLSIPPFDEQKEIVRQVDKLFALADKVEEHYQKARVQVDALAQSVLAKAFRGELVPEDPDDEPAEKLLQRIQEEKAKMENELKTVSRSARGTRRNGTKTQRAGAEEKQAGEP